MLPSILSNKVVESNSEIRSNSSRLNELIRLLVDEDSLSISSKGYCFLFAFLQRPTSLLESQVLLHKRIWKQFVHQILVGNNTFVIINGNVIDACLRFYQQDYNAGKEFWSKELVPDILRVFNLPSFYGKGKWNGQIKECVYSSFASLMFISGCNNRPDESLVIAKVFKSFLISRRFTLQDARSIYKSYNNGKQLFIDNRKSSIFNYVNIAKSSVWENLLKVELFQVD
jgi:hypothetical protein